MWHDRLCKDDRVRLICIECSGLGDEGNMKKVSKTSKKEDGLYWICPICIGKRKEKDGEEIMHGDNNKPGEERELSKLMEEIQLRTERLKNQEIEGIAKFEEKQRDLDIKYQEKEAEMVEMSNELEKLKIEIKQKEGTITLEGKMLEAQTRIYDQEIMDKEDDLRKAEKGREKAEKDLKETRDKLEKAIKEKERKEVEAARSEQERKKEEAGRKRAEEEVDYQRQVTSDMDARNIKNIADLNDDLNDLTRENMNLKQKHKEEGKIQEKIEKLENEIEEQKREIQEKEKIIRKWEEEKQKDEENQKNLENREGREKERSK